ncbi:MAG: fumarylacetoacetate hydrolase family protein [Burkholderiaceae bacterium]
MNDVIEIPALPTRISIRNYVMRFGLHRLHTVGCQLSAHPAIKNNRMASVPRVLSTGSADSVVFVPENVEEKIFCARPVMKCQIQIGLVVAIGKKGRNIATESAFDHVFGYAVGIHMIHEEEQDEHCSSVTDKTSVTHTLVGPITAASQFEHKQAAKLAFGINNGFKHKCGTAMEMTRTVGDTIARLSTLSEMESGDLIFIGALEQCITTKPDDAFLAEIDGLGKLHARVV